MTKNHKEAKQSKKQSSQTAARRKMHEEIPFPKPMSLDEAIGIRAQGVAAIDIRSNINSVGPRSTPLSCQRSNKQNSHVKLLKENRQKTKREGRGF